MCLCSEWQNLAAERPCWHSAANEGRNTHGRSVGGRQGSQRTLVQGEICVCHPRGFAICASKPVCDVILCLSNHNHGSIHLHSFALLLGVLQLTVWETFWISCRIRMPSKPTSWVNEHIAVCFCEKRNSTEMECVGTFDEGLCVCETGVVSED